MKEQNIIEEAQRIVSNLADKEKKSRFSPTEFFARNERALDACIILATLLLVSVLIKLFTL